MSDHIGIRSLDVQDRFGITHQEVKKLEKSGFLKISGYETARLYGRYVKVPLYNPVQVFALTVERVRDELKKLSGLNSRR